MGNQLARTTQVSPSEYYLQDLPSSYNLVLKEALGGGRFLKSVQCVHDKGLLLVKVYFKRGESPDLEEYKEKLIDIQERLKDIEQSHVWPFQSWLETDKAAYLLRQYFFSNLHDRINTRPFLSLLEKKWLTFQLLHALKQSHERGVCHGDIKCENVLVTSWNWVYLADYCGSLKPTLLPVDNPADFSFFFDTGSRRRCYLAPERFYEPNVDSFATSDAPLTPAMDIFSVGCVISEMFLEREPLFDLSQLLAYRQGKFDPRPSLEKIPDAGVRDMILDMINILPEERSSADHYLKMWCPRVFPEYLSRLLHDFFSCLVHLNADYRVAVTQSFFPEICKQMLADSQRRQSGEVGGGGIADLVSPRRLNLSFSQEKEDSHVEDFIVDKPTALAMGEAGSAVQEVVTEEIYENQVRELGGSFRGIGLDFQAQNSSSDTTKVFDSGNHATLDQSQHCEGIVLIASVLCSCLRNIKLPQARRATIQLLKESSLYIDDDARLQHVVPYVAALLSDNAAIVRCAALQTLCDVLSLVQVFPPSDAKLFPEYILPLLSMLPDDPEESVRIAYAANIHKIAETANRFLMHSQEIHEIGGLDFPANRARGSLSERKSTSTKQGNSAGSGTGRLEGDLAELREAIAHVIQELVMGQKQTPTIRRALLQHMGSLCRFFGPKYNNDFLLPILPAFLNDRDEQLRAAFFKYIVHVCLFVGQMSLEAYLLPYVEQALNDVEETVIINAMECLTALCTRGVLRKRVLLEAVERACPLLCHPSQRVRRAAMAFVAATSANLEPTDSYSFLSPILLPFLRREPASLCSEAALLACLKPPVPREVFNRILNDVMQPQTEREKATATQQGIQKTNNRRVAPTQLQDPRVQVYGSGRQLPQKPLTGEQEYGETMKVMEGYVRNLSSTMQTRMHNWEAENTEKIQSSAIDLTAGVGAGFYSNYDGFSEGIPLYSVPLSGKKPDSTPTGQGGEVDEEWSRVFDVGQGSAPFLMANVAETPIIASKGPASSQWTNIAGHSLMPCIDPSSQRSHRGFAVLRDTGQQDSGEGLVATGSGSGINSMSTSKATLASSEMLENKTSRNPSPVNDVFVGEASLDSVSPLLSPLGATESSWRPRGILIAHLQEHHRAVNEVAVSNDNIFLASASDDGTVKIWDCRRLERDISFRSRLTYPLPSEGRALHVSILGDGHQVAAASSKGTMHVFTVDYVPRQGGSTERYTGFSDTHKWDTQKGNALTMQNLFPEGPSLLLYSTQRNGIHLWDLRIRNDSWTVRTKPDQGYISAISVDPACMWFVSATSRGVLTLWDLRFQIAVNTWQHPACCPVDSMCVLVPGKATPASTTQHPYVYVAAGHNEVALWNAVDGTCHEVLRFCTDIAAAHTEMNSVPGALSQSLSNSQSARDTKLIGGVKVTDYRIEELNEPPPRLPGVRTLLPLSGGAALLTGGSDSRIRMWDRLRPDRSYHVCGPTMGKSSSTCVQTYEIRSLNGVCIVQESPKTIKSPSQNGLAAAATDTAGCHRDCILNLASAQTNQRLLISSSRDGAIKVWK